MQKISAFVVAVLTCILFLGSTPAMAANHGELTGTLWQESTQNEKMALIYGMASVVAIEKTIADRQKVKPTAFVGSWTKALGNASPKSIVEQIDSWYGAHPSELNRSVFSVLWYEIIVPEATK